MSITGSGSTRSPEPEEPLDAAAQALQDLHRSLNPYKEFETYLGKLCQHAVDIIPEASMAGVTLIDDTGTPATSVHTHPTVLEIDALQYRLGQGPCLDAADTHTVIAAGPHDAAQRWPALTRKAETYGVASYLSVPLEHLRPGVRTGSVNLYSSQHHGFRTAEAALMNLFTTAADYAISSAERYRDARNLAQHLERALDSRAAIDQAKGILMAVHGIAAHTAFTMLVDESQRKNEKLRTIAEALITRASTHNPTTTP